MTRTTDKRLEALERAAETYVPYRRPWTPSERKLLKMFYGRVSNRVLAEQLGRTVPAVQWQWANMMTAASRVKGRQKPNESCSGDGGNA